MAYFYFLLFSKYKSLKIDEVTFIIKYNYIWKSFSLFTLFSRSNIETFDLENLL